MIEISSENITFDFIHSIGSEEVHINHKNETFYFKFNIKSSSNKLAIHTNGAVDFSIKTPPVFQGLLGGGSLMLIAYSLMIKL